jgi:spermidine dehydrogenase
MSEITRRDFLNGAALAVLSGATPAPLLAQAQTDAYPPGLGGWRGSTPGSYDVAHVLRDGKRYPLGRMPIEERYDLIVVGAGIGGLAAAHFFRKVRPDARILILDNHDDFGGHARRNEFDFDGRLLVSYGGSESIQSPKSEWSAEALGLLRDVKVDVDRFETAFDRKLYPDLGLSRALFFNREAFGEDKLVRGDPLRMVADDIPADRLNGRPIAEFIADFPIPQDQKSALVALFTERRDVLAGRSLKEKEATLARISYRDFIQRHWQLGEAAANSFQNRSHDFFAIGSDGLPAYDAMEVGYPGFQGLGLPGSANAELEDPYIYHFPDGNASIARLLTRSLIPGVAPGTGMEDIVTARFDYSRLDRADSAARLRLGSTIVMLANQAGRTVDVGYVRANTLHRVQASHVIHSGYATMLPYICPDLRPAQRSALSGAVRSPFVYVKVLVRNWQPWAKVGVHEVTNAMGFFSRLKLDYPVSLGDYRCPSRPDEPMVLHLVHVPTVPMSAGNDQRSAWKAARAQLYTRTFADFESRVRDELTRMFAPGGFDADRDIRAITVNRWGHAYAYGFNSIFDEDEEFAQQALARRRVGRISVAGSDAARSAYAHAAIDQAHRAVAEVAQVLARN